MYRKTMDLLAEETDVIGENTEAKRRFALGRTYD
jgi:hypothetical protein